MVGSGPAGLTCAAFLRRHGAAVCIYEKEKELGGILAHGIPEFRLPRTVLKDGIERILKLGIEVKKEVTLGKDYLLCDLENQYDAVFLGMGANVSAKMHIEGEDLDGVYGGNELLERGIHPVYEGKTVAVIGGGNVAMDTARTIQRKGAKKVFIIYRRAEKQMPAEKKEMEDAKKEGIEFLFQNNIVKIIGDEQNQVTAVECIKTQLVKKEGETREVPVNIEKSNYVMPMDYVIMAVGSKTERGLLESLDIELTERGYIAINEKYQTSHPKVFAGGDLAGMKATVAWAAKSGREAANSMVEILG